MVPLTLALSPKGRGNKKIGTLSPKGIGIPKNRLKAIG